MLQKYESNNIWLWLFGLRTSWLIYSIPNVDVSSTASSSFSSKTSGDGYGGRSKRLKHVWALKKLFVVVIYHIGHNLLGKIQQNRYLYSWKIILPWQAYSFTPLFNAKFPWSIWSPQRRKSFIGYWRSAGYKLQQTKASFVVKSVDSRPEPNNHRMSVMVSWPVNSKAFDTNWSC